MRTFEWVMSPEPRVLARIQAVLRRARTSAVTSERRPGTHAAFITGGQALAAAILAHRPGGELPAAAEELADVMVGELLLVQAASAGDGDADRRVRMAMAVEVLSLIRPQFARVCDPVAHLWTSTGLGAARGMDDPQVLVGRVLLALLRGDLDDAADSVEALADVDHEGVAGVMHDWTVACVQGHGPAREATCFHALRDAISRLTSHGDGPTLVLLAALVLLDRAHRPRTDVIRWLDGVVAEVQAIGTTRRAAR